MIPVEPVSSLYQTSPPLSLHPVEPLASISLEPSSPSDGGSSSMLASSRPSLSNNRLKDQISLGSHRPSQSHSQIGYRDYVERWE